VNLLKYNLFILLYKNLYLNINLKKRKLKKYYSNLKFK